jgi:hypothetical protein
MKVSLFWILPIFWAGVGLGGSLTALILMQVRKFRQRKHSAIKLTAEEEAKIKELSQAMGEAIKRQSEPPQSDTVLLNEEIRRNVVRLHPDLAGRPRSIKNRIIPFLGGEGRC